MHYALCTMKGLQKLLLILHTQNSLYLYMEIDHLNVLLKLFLSYLGLFRIKLAFEQKVAPHHYNHCCNFPKVLHSVLHFFFFFFNKTHM